jgi:hypothetical protein
MGRFPTRFISNEPGSTASRTLKKKKDRKIPTLKRHLSARETESTIAKIKKRAWLAD